MVDYKECYENDCSVVLEVVPTDDLHDHGVPGPPDDGEYEEAWDVQDGFENAG